MEIKRKHFALTIALISVLMFAMGYSIQNGVFNSHKNTQPRVNVYVFKETYESNDLICSGNIMTDWAERYYRNNAGFNNETAFNATQWISLGNSTIVQTNTKLDVEATSDGFSRAANDSVVTWVNAGDFAYNVTKKFTATGTIYINATGLHVSATGNSDNNMVAHAYLGDMEKFETNWNCTIVWAITWDAN